MSFDTSDAQYDPSVLSAAEAIHQRTGCSLPHHLCLDLHRRQAAAALSTLVAETPLLEIKLANPHASAAEWEELVKRISELETRIARRAELKLYRMLLDMLASSGQLTLIRWIRSEARGG